MENQNPMDFVLRVVESMAFGIHSILGITEPWTGCLRGAFQDKGAMPLWFWPTAGVLLGMVSFCNLYFASNDKIIVALQAYIAAFHSGGVFYHIRLKHHPVAGCAPGFFVPFAIGVVAIRVNLLVALLGAVGCAILAVLIGMVLVKPPAPSAQERPLYQD